MNHQKVTLTIGIPAYNEEKNIQYLLASLLNQTKQNYVLKNIFVYSDGSTDSTVQKTQSINSPVIQVINNQKRHGLAKGLNYLIQKSASDILVILNADISLKDNSFLDKLVSSLVNKKADLVSVRMVELPATNFFESVINTSMQFKGRIYESLRGQDNVYACHGQARAFSKRFYKKLTFPFSLAEDAYSYLRCKQLKMKFYYNSDTEAYYRLPNNFIEHRNQSSRFFNSTKILETRFDRDYLRKEYQIPTGLFLKEFAVFFLSHPIKCLFYLGITAVLKFTAHASKSSSQIWNVSVSSKSVSI